MITLTLAFICDCEGCEARFIHSQQSQLGEMSSDMAAVQLPEGWQAVKDNKQVWRIICPRHRVSII